MRKSIRKVTIFGGAFALFLGSLIVVFAVHDTGRNLLTFTPVAGSPSPNASGSGEITLTNGTIANNNDRWSVSARFSGLQSNTQYNIVVLNRFATDGKFSSICSFNTRDGSRCWNSFLILKNLGVAQVRRASDGAIVLEARRANGGIKTIPFDSDRDRSW